MTKHSRPLESPDHGHTSRLEARIEALEKENARLQRLLIGETTGQLKPSDICDNDYRDSFEREILASRNIVRALIDSSDDYFALVDENLRIHACNLAWSRASDIHPRRLVGHSILTVIPRPMRATVKSQLHTAIRENIQTSFTITYEDKTYDCRVNPIDSPSHSPRMLTCSAHDITRLMQAEKLQQEMELRYKTVFDSAGDAIFIHDLQGAFLDANLVFRQLLGYSLEQIRRFKLQDLVSRAEQPPDLLGEPDTMLTFQVDLYRQDGTTLPLDVSARRVTFDNKPALLCIGRDITQRRRVESMLLKAKETAESNVRMQNEFVANISHELRTPLSSIIGITELLTLTKLDDSQRENLRRVAYSADMLLGLINDLLDLSRLESGRFAMASEPFNLLELMREIKNIFLEKVASKNLSFSYNVAEDIPEYLQGDAMRLKQVLINIVGNAIKFTTQGYVHVQLALADSGAPAGDDVVAPDGEGAMDDTVAILFQITDTGIGMSQKDVERIFQRFTQGDNTSGRPYGGAGLGLAISRQLIKHMGGDIRVESTPDRGSTFTFTIRLPVASEPAPRDAGEPVPHETIAPLKVLLAEDNDINREMIKAMIRTDGHYVRTATDGLEALAILEDFTPDVIFMDLQMPRCDGYEAARLIRSPENQHLARTPIIALSAHVHKSTDDDWRTMGMDGYLSKPIQLATLRQALASAAGGKCLPGRCEEEVQEEENEAVMLDLDTLRENMGHKDELVRLACEKFLSHANRYISDLESAVDRRDRKDTRRLAHSFKSVTATIGAERARQVALAMEKEAPTEEWELLETRLARLSDLVQELHTLVGNAPELAASSFDTPRAE